MAVCCIHTATTPYRYLLYVSHTASPCYGAVWPIIQQKSCCMLLYGPYSNSHTAAIQPYTIQQPSPPEPRARAEHEPGTRAVQAGSRPRACPELQYQAHPSPLFLSPPPPSTVGPHTAPLRCVWPRCCQRTAQVWPRQPSTSGPRVASAWRGLSAGGRALCFNPTLPLYSPHPILTPTRLRPPHP